MNCRIASLIKTVPVVSQTPSKSRTTITVIVEFSTVKCRVWRAQVCHVVTSIWTVVWFSLVSLKFFIDAKLFYYRGPVGPSVRTRVGINKTVGFESTSLEMQLEAWKYVGNIYQWAGLFFITPFFPTLVRTIVILSFI